MKKSMKSQLENKTMDSLTDIGVKVELIEQDVTSDSNVYKCKFGDVRFLIIEKTDLEDYNVDFSLSVATDPADAVIVGSQIDMALQGIGKTMVVNESYYSDKKNNELLFGNEAFQSFIEDKVELLLLDSKVIEEQSRLLEEMSEDEMFEC